MILSIKMILLLTKRWEGLITVSTLNQEFSQVRQKLDITANQSYIVWKPNYDKKGYTIHQKQSRKSTKSNQYDVRCAY